ncbi:facilitated trehalose transporter Tret1-like [Pectinophora gossypiella]|uniref:facilitated trehalose transporter Tret1-like n=1 Tax=Pectinophora gossypiella TaxID=13191 RepID=UPI00214F3239|nr:facilitated trehalose transporter Tret1-like [Pectinophora gossypiella]
MATCKYLQVDPELRDEPQELQSISWKPFLRQLLVCCSLFTTYFVTGLSLGAPTVVIPQLRKTRVVSDEMASWLSSVFSYSAMPWVVILPTISQRVGRKPPFYFAISISIASFFILYFGNTTTHFIVSQLLQGILLGSNLTISIILITECTSPKYRGIFLAIKSANIWWGMWAANAIGTFFHWNYIGLCGLICSAMYVTVFIWPESPYWLATRGRFDECARAHRWLKGVDKCAEDELEKLIISQKDHTQFHSRSTTVKEKITNMLRLVTLKEFYMPISLSVLVIAQYHSSGKIVCSIYSIELIKKITESESTAYMGMLILDGVSVLGMYVGSGLSKIVTRRKLLLVSSASGILFIFALSLYIWLVEMFFISENKIVSLLLLSACSLSLSCGPVIMSMSIYAELIPLRFKSSGVIITILMHFALMGTTIKIAPLVFSTLRLYGAFSLYGVLFSALSYVLYKYLPETKDKTLQEIEEYFKGSSKDELKDAKELVELNKK